MNPRDTNLLELKFANRGEVYRKITDDQTELRRILFEGTFKNINKSGEVIQFKKDGQVIGIDNLKYFTLVYDFVEGINFDACILTIKPDDFWINGEAFHYKINQDTLRLYRINLDTIGVDHKIGELKHLLKRSD